MRELRYENALLDILAEYQFVDSKDWKPREHRMMHYVLSVLPKEQVDRWYEKRVVGRDEQGVPLNSKGNPVTR